MTTSQKNTHRSLTTRRVVLAVLGWFLAGTLPVAASPITSVRRAFNRLNLPGLNGSNSDKDFEAFLAGGPSHWTDAPLMKVPSGLSVLGPDGALKNNRVVGYLNWQRGQHPAHFDRRHPILG